MNIFVISILLSVLFCNCFAYPKKRIDDTSISYDRATNINEVRSFGNTEESVKRIAKLKDKKLIDNLLIEAQAIFNHCSSTGDFIKPFSKVKLNSDPKNVCTDPAPAVMLANLVKIQYIFKDLIGLLDIKEVQGAFSKYIDTNVPETRDPLTFGSHMCETKDLNLTKINEMSICPWHATIHIRENRYPMMVSHAKCNCKQCLHLKDMTIKQDVNYKCMPVYRLSPALIRDENCDPNIGVYEWRPILEKIAVTCVCSRDNKLFLATND